LDSQKEKAPEGYSISSWDLYMRSFWKTKCINPPEEQGKLLGNATARRRITRIKYQNPPFWSIGK
jgi:hypothetical protein